MYEYIKGNITYVSPYYIVVETGGVGYQIAVANPFKYTVSEKELVTVYVYQAIREDAHTLYGFTNLEEKQLFTRLISVSGIGPKSALAIMASDDHIGLVQAIESENATYLIKFPGVGKKTAQQMILDLRGKLGEIALQGEANSPIVLFDTTTSSSNLSLEEAIEALKALGYSEREVKRIAKDLEKLEETTTDSYLRHGLKLLMKK